MPPFSEPSLGHNAFMMGVARRDELAELELLLADDDEHEEEDEDGKLPLPPPTPPPVTDDVSNGSGRRVRRPCFELLCTNMLSEIASK